MKSERKTPPKRIVRCRLRGTGERQQLRDALKIWAKKNRSRP